MKTRKELIFFKKKEAKVARKFNMQLFSLKLQPITISSHFLFASNSQVLKESLFPFMCFTANGLLFLTF